jgi:hypothetical protein
MWRWIASVFYIVVSTLTKLVIGFFLLRICSHRRWQRFTIWILMSVVSIFNLFYIFIDIFACQPVEYEWTRYNPVPPDGQCNSTLFATVPTYLSAFLNVLADWMLPILPATMVWNAKMDRRTKISVCAILALGSLYVLPLPSYSNHKSPMQLLTPRIPLQSVNRHYCPSSICRRHLRPT